MKTEFLLHAIGSIRDDLIEEAEQDTCIRRKHKTEGRRGRAFWGILAACLALACCIGITTGYLRANAAVGAFTMDINPGVEYTVAKNGTVKDVRFLNRDAEEALRDVTLTRQTVKEAVADTVAAYRAHGYAEDNSTVLISFDARICENGRLRSELSAAIRSALERSAAIDTVIFHDESDDVRAQELSNALQISLGKADCILTASEQSGLSASELALLPLEDILLWQEELHADPIHTKYIGMQKAKRIAIRDAGCTGRVTFTEETLVDGGIKTPYYRLVFSDTETRWTYRIDAVLGIVLERGKEHIGAVEFLSLEKAKAIALRDAGLENADVKVVFTKEELNRNQGKPCYLLEFYAGAYQFFYQIDARTGSITYGQRYLLPAEAKRIAIEDAGCTDKVTFTEETLVDGGIKTPYYRLVFSDTETRWTYRIDAVLGIVLERSKEHIGAVEFLSLDEAKRIAIEDAGCTDKVTFTEETLVDGGIKTPYWRLVFSDTETRWTYRIDAVLGIVLERSKEHIGAAEFLSLDEAKAIALRDAGLDDAAQKIVFTKEELNRNQGKPCYLLKFHTDRSVWFYRIDAVTGDITEKSSGPL